MKEKILWGIAVVAFVLGGWTFVKLPHTAKLPSGQFGATGNLLAENYIPYILYNGGFNTAKEFSVSATSTFAGPMVQDSGVTCSSANATTTTTSSNAQTLYENDFAPGGRPYCYVSIAQTRTSAAPATTTLDVSATTTWTTAIPAVGDSFQTVFQMATSTNSAPGATLAFGAGMIVETASTTANSLTIAGGERATLRFTRLWNTDIGVDITIRRQANTNK